VVARVKGSRPQPYAVRIELPTLADETWERVIAALSSSARFAASLLAGKMPPDIDQVFAEHGAHLFPASEDELETDCSCPDWANPCKHVAAVHYVLGAELDRDPFLLFRLRGRSRDQVIAALRALRSPADAAAPSTTSDTGSSDRVSPERQLERHWSVGEEFASLRFAVARPQVAEAVLKRLGPPPTLHEGDVPPAELARLYRVISERALRSAYDSDEA